MPGSSNSRNVYCANSSSYPYTMSVSWSQGFQSIPNNTSVISASGSMSGQYVSFAAGVSYTYYLRLYWHDNRTNDDTLFATSEGFNSLGMGYGSRSVSGSITVTHNANGSLSGYVWMRFESPSVSGGWAPGTTDLSTTNTALTTIPRASDFTINAGSALLGSAVSITINRKASFTHKVTYQFVNSSVTTVSSSATTSASFTPPVSLASQIPNSVTGSLKVTVTTMNGSTQIGSAVTKSVTLSVPTSVVPTMGTPTATRVNNEVPSSWGIYVQGYSQATITINSAAGAYGSTIKSYSIIGPGLNVASSSGKTSVLTTPGTNTYRCMITDSRGRSTTKTVSVSVVAYSTPSISLSASRCNSAGTITENGTYLRVTCDYSIASVSSKNSVASKLVKCNGVSNTTFGDGVAFTLAANCSVGTSYICTATITDALGNTSTVSVDIRVASRIINVKKNKKSVAIGKIAETDNMFEVGWNSHFLNPVTIDDTTIIKGNRYVHIADTGGNSGYTKFARLTIKQSGIDNPINMTISQGLLRSPIRLSIAFNIPASTDPTLNGSRFTFEGEDDANIYINYVNSSTWDLYISNKLAGDDHIHVLDFNAGYNSSEVQVVWLNEQVSASALPSGAIKATNVNNLTRYNASGINPNTTLYPLILTNHANRPSSVSAYWYIQTFFYSQKTSTSARSQIALPYSTKASMYHRYYHEGTWGAWRRLVNEDELTPQEYRFQFSPFASLSSSNSFTLVIHKVMRMCFVTLRWIGNCNVSTDTFNEVTIPKGYRPMLSTVHATCKNVSGTNNWGSTRYQIGNSDGKITFHTDNQGFLERFANFSYISDS